MSDKQDSGAQHSEQVIPDDHPNLHDNGVVRTFTGP